MSDHSSERQSNTWENFEPHKLVAVKHLKRCGVTSVSGSGIPPKKHHYPSELGVVPSKSNVTSSSKYGTYGTT